MPRLTNVPPRPVGQMLVPASTISALSLILAAGLELLGWLKQGNQEIARKLVLNAEAHHGARHLPEEIVWLAAAAASFGLAYAMLGSPGLARRTFLWLVTMLLVAAWAPVLTLASYAPDIGAPWIATAWAGFCAMVYAANHRMPCDAATPTPKVTMPTRPDDAR